MDYRPPPYCSRITRATGRAFPPSLRAPEGPYGRGPLRPPGGGLIRPSATFSSAEEKALAGIPRGARELSPPPDTPPAGFPLASAEERGSGGPRSQTGLGEARPAHHAPPPLERLLGVVAASICPSHEKRFPDMMGVWNAVETALFWWRG